MEHGAPLIATLSGSGYRRAKVSDDLEHFQEYRRVTNLFEGRRSLMVAPARQIGFALYHS
jgi:hypothetical protein